MSIESLSRSEIEEQLSAYWCELLGIEAVKRNDHFLEIGGNSMMATILANRIEDEMGVRPSMEELFNTLEHLAMACEALMEERRNGDIPDFLDAERPYGSPEIEF